MTAGPGPDRRVAGGNNMSASFDVLVRSVDALNASVRLLSQDMRRSYDARARFAPGQEGEAARRASEGMPNPDQEGNYDHGAGRTTHQSMSLSRAARSFAQRVFSSQQQTPPPPPPQQQNQPLPAYNPMQGYTFGPQMPFQPLPFQPGAPQGPPGPQGPGQGPPGPPGGPGGPGGPHGPQYGFGGQQHGGGGWTNMLLGGARRIPYVGTAMAATGAVGNLYQSEREKNRFYQGMEGGSNFSGFGERFHEEAYRWSMGAGMSSDMARRSFKGVTSLGYTGKSKTGQGRQDALNFVYHNYNCVDVETEIFTRRGWLRYDEVQEGDWSLALNPDTGLMEWAEIESVYRKHIQAPVMRIKSKLHSSVTTLNHRWVVWSTQQRKFVWTTTDTMNASHRVPLAALGGAATEMKYSDELVELAAWYFTEGSSQGVRKRSQSIRRGVTRAKNPERRVNGSISQSVIRNPENCARIERCLRALAGDPGVNHRNEILQHARARRWGSPTEGLEHKWRVEEREDGVRAYLFGEEVMEALSEIVVGADKVPAPEFLSALTQAQLELFISTCIRGDGRIRPAGVGLDGYRRDEHRAFMQHHTGRMGAFQFACVLAGIPVGVNASGTQATLLKTSSIRLAYLHSYRRGWTQEDYDGVIWCPSLKHRNWVARREGKIYITGNTRGMDVEESLGMIQTASKDATVTFGELSEALKEVSDTAGKAGVNAKFMRQSFQGMLQSSISTGAGPGASDLAGIFSSTQASYGREFQGSNFRGQLDTGYQYMIGAQYGVNPGQLQGIMRNQPGQYARMVSGSQRDVINMAFGPAQVKDLQDLVKKYGSGQQAIPQIEQEFLNSHPEIDLNVVAQTLSGALTGVELDNSNVMDWVIQQLAGNTAAAHAPQQGQNARAPFKANDKTATGKAQQGKYGLYQPDGVDKFGLGGIGMLLTTLHADKGTLGFGGSHNKAAKTYVDQYINKKQQRDPVLEAILQNVEEPNKTNVRVSTASGDRIVSLEEAMRLFPNELARGDVQIVSGKQSGKTVSDVVGGNVDKTRDIRGELTSKAGQGAGQTVNQYEKNYGPIKKAGGGDVVGQRVTVDLSTEAKRLLQLLPSTNNESQATGYPPYNPNSGQGSRP